MNRQHRRRAAPLILPLALALAAGCNSAGDGADGNDTNGRGISENVVGTPVENGPGGTSAGTQANAVTGDPGGRVVTPK
jgi:hypothetical protein